MSTPAEDNGKLPMPTEAAAPAPTAAPAPAPAPAVPEVPVGAARGTSSPPPRLNLPTRLSDQVPGLATYQLPSGAANSGSGALHITDRDRKETRKVRTMLASVVLFVVVVFGAIILAGSHAQPMPEERLAWNQEEMAVVQRVLLRTGLAQYNDALHSADANGDAGKAIHAIVLHGLQTEYNRVSKYIETAECQSDADMWTRKRREKYILERALGWIDGYDRPFQVSEKNMRLTVLSMGANGRVDTAADFLKDDTTACVTLPSGKPMEVQKWEDVFTLPDMSAVEMFDPANPKTMDKLRSLDPDHLTPRERAIERRYEMQNMMDGAQYDGELNQKLQEYEAAEGLPKSESFKQHKRALKPDALPDASDGSLPGTTPKQPPKLLPK